MELGIKGGGRCQSTNDTATLEQKMSHFVDLWGAEYRYVHWLD